MRRTLAKKEVIITRSEANFDKACELAYGRALYEFDIDHDGHSKSLKSWERSCCSIEVSFKNYIGTANHHHYIFMASAIKETE